MTVKERHASRDGFPVGMRVLAVDDDPTCLKILERLLLQCRYHVTTTGQAVTALNLLRENKDQFDLVISDVHMPDMDGFKLLELVGLEMDLPVIMLSTNGETQIVMNGITHGACDYLLKPVRIEELRNIWQHVVRRRKFDAKDHSKGDNVDGGQKMQAMNSEGEQSGVNRNRKHLRNGREENGDDGNDSDHENADLSTQKRPRVVWSVELHRKFVAAVNQLGIDKAVPKKILDLMNVDSITRENVASHLQKYRLYLKRLSTDVTNQPNLAATFGGSNPTFINVNSLEAFKHYHAYGRYRSVPSVASSQGNKLLERMNTPSTFGVHGLLPSQSAQLVHPQNNVGISLKDLGGFTQGNLLKSTLLSLQEGSKCFPTGPSRNNFANISNGAPSGNSSANISNGASLAPVNKLPVQPLESSNQPLVPMHSSSTDPFNALVDGEAPQFPDLGRFSNTRQSVVPPKFQDAHKDNMSQAALHVNGPKVKPLSSFAEPSGHAPVLGNGLQSLAASLASNTTEVANFNQEAASFNFGTCGNSMDMLNNNLSFSPSSINSSLPDLCADSSVVARQSLDGGNPVGVPPAQHSRIDQEAVGNQLNYNDDFLTGTRELHSGASGALDDIAIDMFNPDREGGISFMDEDWELVTIP